MFDFVAWFVLTGTNTAESISGETRCADYCFPRKEDLISYILMSC